VPRRLGKHPVASNRIFPAAERQDLAASLEILTNVNPKQ
jgi:hypothetical protein